MSDKVTKEVDIKVSASGAEKVPGLFARIGHEIHEMNQQARGGAFHGIETLLKGAGAAAVFKFGAESIKGIAEAYGEVAKGQLTVTEGFFKMASAIPILGSAVDAADALGKALRAANHPEDAANAAAIASGKLRGEAFKSSYDFLAAVRRGDLLSRGDPFVKMREDATAKFEESQKKIDELRQQRADLVKRDFEMRANQKEQMPQAQIEIERSEMEKNAQAIDLLDERIAESGKLAADIRTRAWKEANESQINGLQSLKDAFVETFDEAGKHVKETINAVGVADLREKIKRGLGLLGVDVNFFKNDFADAWQQYHLRQARKSGWDYFQNAPNPAGFAPASEGRFLTGGTPQNQTAQKIDRSNELLKQVVDKASDLVDLLRNNALIGDDAVYVK